MCVTYTILGGTLTTHTTMFHLHEVTGQTSKELQDIPLLPYRPTPMKIVVLTCSCRLFLVIGDIYEIPGRVLVRTVSDQYPSPVP